MIPPQPPVFGSSSTSPLNLRPPKRLGHLGLIAGILQSAKVLDLIDTVCGVDPRMKVSHGECVQFLLLGVFAGEHGLWRLAERLDPYDLATLTGDAGISLTEFHDVRLGRMLDAIWDAGPERLLSAIALRIVEWSKLELGTLHFDTTSLSFYGAYEEDMDDTWAPELEGVLDPRQVPARDPRGEDTRDGDGRDAPVVTYGYAKNRRHDLKQILFGMVVAGDGGVPLYGRALDGNASDITAAAEFLDHLRRQIPDPRGQVFVADSKGWAPPALECVRQHQLRLLSRLPRSTRLAGETVARLDLDYASCLLKHYHKDRKRWSWVAYAGFDEVYSFTIDEPVLDQQGKPQTGEDGQPLMHTCRHTLPVRVVACYSSELYRQKAETLGAITKREEVRSARLIRRLGQRLFACAADAQAEIDALVAKQPFITLTLAGTVTRREIHNRRSRRGRPAKGETPPSPDIRYTIALTVTPASPTENASRLQREATYVLIRNRIDGWEITDEQMVATYSKQWRVEHAFSWLKSGAAINPMFVQTPRRIQALCFLYTLALMIHALVQRNLRRYLKQHGLKLPYHRNKPSQNITARFTYELFRNVTSQIVEFNGQTNKHIHGLDQWTSIAIAGVGGSTATYQPVMEQAR
jgi:transposase